MTIYNFPVDGATFTLSVFNASSHRGWRLSATVGTFVLTGEAATLFKATYSLLAAAGSFTLTGKTVSWGLSKLCATGTFVVSGFFLRVATRWQTVTRAFTGAGPSRESDDSLRSTRTDPPKLTRL